jgi:hypothetical protein
MERLVALATSTIEMMSVVVGRIGVAEKELRSGEVVVLARDEVVRTALVKTYETETAMGNECEPSIVPEDDGISYCASVVRKRE